MQIIYNSLEEQSYLKCVMSKIFQFIAVIQYRIKCKDLPPVQVLSNYWSFTTLADSLCEKDKETSNCPWQLCLYSTLYDFGSIQTFHEEVMKNELMA